MIAISAPVCYNYKRLTVKTDLGRIWGHHRGIVHLEPVAIGVIFVLYTSQANLNRKAGILLSVRVL